MKGKRKRKGQKRLLGTFSVQSDFTAAGDLKLQGEDTQLRIFSDQFIPPVSAGATLTGHAYSGEFITLLDCLCPGSGSSHSPGGATRYNAKIFPHYVLVGRRHLYPTTEKLAGIHFSTTDLGNLFYDFDAFGTLPAPGPLIDDVLRERRAIRPVPTGDNPTIQYYTGHARIADVPTVLGRVLVHHNPRWTLGGPEGVSIRNQLSVSIEPTDPLPFADLIGGMHDLLCFLSVSAGRAQGVSDVHVSTGPLSGSPTDFLRVHISHAPKCTDRTELHRPHPGDVPLDPISEPEEFSTVLANWIRNHRERGFARARYLDCLRKNNFYDLDRLVAAANMFDILPIDAFPPLPALSPALSATRDQCIGLLRAHPSGIDRDSALSALSRMGRYSLPKRVLHRTSIVQTACGSKFPDLELVVRTAVKCRNYFVHGSSDDLDFSKVDTSTTFLTDALEFVFGASDLIDSGWNMQRWLSRPMGWGHSFARFRHGYDHGLAVLKTALSAQ